MTGMRWTEERRIEQSKRKKKYWDEHPEQKKIVAERMHNRIVTDQTKEKTSKSVKLLHINGVYDNVEYTSKTKGKTYEELYGIEEAAKMREQRSISTTRYMASEEARENLRIKRKSYIVRDETRKKLSEWQTGIKRGPYSEEHRKHISESLIGKYAGPKSGVWKGGSSFIPYCPKFNDRVKEEVREIFGRKCFWCGKLESENYTKAGKHKRLHVHHVFYDKLEGCNGKNMTLIPLCNVCHSKTCNTKEEYFIEMFCNMLYAHMLRIILLLD